MSDFPLAADITVRSAGPEDLDSLLRIEEVCFSCDRISRRQFRYLLSRGNATVLIADQAGEPVAAAVVLMSRATSVARLYSLAVLPSARRRGIARHLLAQAEKLASDAHRLWLRLEVRHDNHAATGLFASAGFRRLTELLGYYEDQMSAWRMEKPLQHPHAPSVREVPFYEQTLEFTCGPASLMMAMKAVRPTFSFDRITELRLWREATTIFMTAGHGGCGPFGLALAATKRGFDVSVRASTEGIHLIDSVRGADRKAVVELVQADMALQLRDAAVPIETAPVTPDWLAQEIAAGGVPLVLISSWQMYREKFPHWVVVTGCDGNFVYLHDPYIDRKSCKEAVDVINIPLARERFVKMSRYGRTRLQAAVIVREKMPTSR